MVETERSPGLLFYNFIFLFIFMLSSKFLVKCNKQMKNVNFRLILHILRIFKKKG